MSDFLKKGKYKQHIHRVQRSYKHNQKRLFQQLTEALNRYEHMRERYYISQPEGGFLCWLTLPLGTDGTEIYKQALNEQISVLPGTMFCTQEQYKHCLRVSFASYRENDKWKNGIETLARIIAEHCKIIPNN